MKVANLKATTKTTTDSNGHSGQKWGVAAAATINEVESQPH